MSFASLSTQPTRPAALYRAAHHQTGYGALCGFSDDGIMPLFCPTCQPAPRNA